MLLQVANEQQFSGRTMQGTNVNQAVVVIPCVSG